MEQGRERQARRHLRLIRARLVSLDSRQAHVTQSKCMRLQYRLADALRGVTRESGSMHGEEAIQAGSRKPGWRIEEVIVGRLRHCATTDHTSATVLTRRDDRSGIAPLQRKVCGLRPSPRAPRRFVLGYRHLGAFFVVLMSPDEKNVVFNVPLDGQAKRGIAEGVTQARSKARQAQSAVQRSDAALRFRKGRIPRPTRHRAQDAVLICRGATTCALTASVRLRAQFLTAL